MTILELFVSLAKIVTAAGIIIALFHWRDLRTWNKMSMAIKLLPPPHQLHEFETKLNDSFLQIIDRTSPITEADVDKLFEPGNASLRILLKNYFNMFEMYCAAINHGVVDIEVARTIYRYKFERHFIEFKPYIMRLRGRQGQGFMTEMQTVLARWMPNPNAKKHF